MSAPQFPQHALTAHALNVPYSKLLSYAESDLRQWGTDVRELIANEWKQHNTYPDAGPTEERCDVALARSAKGTVTVRRDMKTALNDCLEHRDAIGPITRAFFPNIGKVRDTTSTKSDGRSLWDFFTSYDAAIAQGWLKRVDRHFRTDGFYKFASVVLTKENAKLFDAASGEAWIRRFVSYASAHGEFGIFVENLPPKMRQAAGKHALTISEATLRTLLSERVLMSEQVVAPFYQTRKRTDRYRIRYYRRNERVFPTGFSFIQKGLVLSATNFPPSVAKFIYETYTDPNERSVIYDPSAGFGGRLIGALATSANRNIHYIGTDPNSEHVYADGRSRYDDLADFYRAHVSQSRFATTEFYQLGSEVIGSDANFLKWKGKVDLVFTSPPYFAAEGYADEPTQSAKKFPDYALWRDGFLKPTLETACEWLKPGGYLAWNISDTKVNGFMQPLESDSIRILEGLGMKFEKTWKMLLARAPGSRKSRRTRKFAMPYKNSCLVGARMYRYEPIFIFRKPASSAFLPCCRAKQENPNKSFS